MRCKLAGAGANRGGRQLMRLGREGWRGQFRCGQRGKCRHEVETREFKQEKLGESIQQLALIWQYLDTICDFTSWFFLISADKEWSRANTSLQAEYKFTVVQIYQTFTLEYESLSQVSLQSVWSPTPPFAHLKFCHCPFLWRLLVLKEI